MNSDPQACTASTFPPKSSPLPIKRWLKMKVVIPFPKPDFTHTQPMFSAFAVLDPTRQAFQKLDLLTKTEGGVAELNLG